MDWELEKVREENWIKSSIESQIQVPDQRIDEFWVHHNLLAPINDHFWRKLFGQATDLNISLGVIQTDIADNGYSDSMVLMFSSEVGPEEVARHLFDEARQLMTAVCQELPFVELGTPEGHFHLDVLTGQLELMQP